MTKSLTENTWVYTDKGIENVHWCNVYGVDELVTPKGKVLAPVPSYSEYQALKDNCEFTHTRLKGTHQKITQLKKKLAIATKALDHCQGFDFVQYALKEMEGVK